MQTVLREVGSEHVLAREVLYEGTHIVPPHEHALPQICFVLEGTMLDRSSEATLLCTPATLDFIPASRSHENLVQAGARDITLTLRSAALLDSCADWRERFQLPQVYIRSLVPLIRRELWSADGAGALIVAAQVFEIVSRMRRAREDRIPPVERARDFIARNCREALSVGAIAEAAGIAPRVLGRDFRQRFGVSLFAYLTECRVRAAAVVIETTSASIAEIAAAHGFFDQPHFTRCFRRVYGVTPAKHRALHRGIGRG